MPYKEDPPKPVDYVVNALLFVPVSSGVIIWRNT